MRVVLFGAGTIGSVHAGNLTAHPEVEELLIADLDRQRGGALAERSAARPIDPAAAFDSHPDAAVIAVATPAHGPLVRRCIEEGVPCFCEKPLAGTVDETVSLTRAAERHQAIVQVGFMRRFDAAIAELRGLIVGGDLGRVDVLRVASHDHEPPSEQYAAGSGGIFRDQLIHDFDMLRWVANSEVAWVYAAGSIRSLGFLEPLGDVDTTVLALGLTAGPLAVMTGSREDGRGEDVRIEAIGSRDSASAGLNGRTPLRLCDPVGVNPDLPPYGDALERFADAFTAELDHFLAAARGERRSFCTPRDALQTLLVAEAAERSLAANAPVATRHAEDVLGEP